MDINVVGRNFSVDEFDSTVPEVGSDKTGLIEGMSTSGEMIEELGRAGQVLTRLELDLACSSEKLVNLSILTMHVATRETDFENLALSKEEMPADSVEKALEFGLLSGILDSEVKEVDKFLSILHTEIMNGHELISSFKHWGDTFEEMEQKLHDSEESLKQSGDQISELKMQSAKFQRTLHGEENWNGDRAADISEDGQFVNVTPKIKMQTAEQQRQILRMLEKSLARELDLEKKLAESRQFEEELNRRLISSEQEVFSLEEDMTDIHGRLFEAENAAEVYMGLSKELLGRIQILQFNMNGSMKRETELRSKIEISKEQLESKESALQKLSSGNAKLNDFLLAQTEGLKASLTEAEDKLILANSEAFTLREKVGLLERQLEETEFQLLNLKASTEGSEEQHNTLSFEIIEMEKVVEDLKDKLSKAETRAESADAKCKLLAETNMELYDELGLLKGSGATMEKVNSLERELRESDVRLQHAVASAEAGQEKQNMLYSTIRDMENLIENLKSKVSKAENRADTAEEKCIILSEANAELNEELKFLKGKLKCLEASLYQVEETKMATVRNIGIHTKVIANLVMQLAIERDRLHKQISSLAVENKVLVVKLERTNKDSTTFMSHNNSGNDVPTATCAKETKEEVNEYSSTASELDMAQKNVAVDETGVAPADSGLNSMRRVDVGMLSFKHVFVAMLVLLISAAVYFFQHENCPF